VSNTGKHKSDPSGFKIMIINYMLNNVNHGSLSYNPRFSQCYKAVKVAALI